MWLVVNFLCSSTTLWANTLAVWGCPFTHPVFKHLGLLAFRCLGFFYHSPCAINDFICLDLLRDLMDCLEVAIRSLKRDLKLFFSRDLILNFYIPEMRYLLKKNPNKNFFQMSKEGTEIKECLTALSYKVLNKIEPKFSQRCSTNGQKARVTRCGKESFKVLFTYRNSPWKWLSTGCQKACGISPIGDF